MNAVIDTNIWLDWLVFDEPGTRSLLSACRTGRFRIRATPAMRQELKAVLRYRAFGLEPDARATAIASFDRLVVIDDDSKPLLDRSRLLCRDPLDQMFVDHAIRTASRWLISRDRQLLALARRARRHGLIVTPPQGSRLVAELAAEPEQSEWPS